MASHPYFGQRIVLTTKHDKLRLIKPAFDELIGCELFELVNPDAFRQEKLGCVKCDHVELGKVLSSVLDPAQCQFCNP